MIIKRRTMYYGAFVFKLGIPIMIIPLHNSSLKLYPSVKVPRKTIQRIAPDLF